MKHANLAAFLLLAAAPALFAHPGSPRVSNVVLRQPQPGTAVVTYDLDEDAVVTAEFVMDGAALPAKTVQTLSGDVNRKVLAGSGRSFTWKANEDWPDHTVAAASVHVTAWAPLAPPDYMAVDLRPDAEAPRVRYYATSNAVPGGVTNRLYKSDVLLMRRIPAAMVRHRQGSPATAPVRGDNETAHWCTLSKDYYMGVYEFTEAQNTLVGGTRTSTPSFVTGDESRFYPVTSVFWYNNIRGDGNSSYVWTSPPASASTIGKLRTRTGLATIDLPTDAQWEYACRAGASTTLYDGTESGYNGDGLARAQALAWINSNASSHPHEVGLKTPNAWGLYDMLGNVLEWCRDGATAYSNADDVVDPVLSAPQFMLRGGSFATSSYDATCSSRNNAYGGWNSSGVASRCGFRPMCAIPAED